MIELLPLSLPTNVAALLRLRDVNHWKCTSFFIDPLAEENPWGLKGGYASIFAPLFKDTQEASPEIREFLENQVEYEKIYSDNFSTKELSLNHIVGLVHRPETQYVIDQRWIGIATSYFLVSKEEPIGYAVQMDVYNGFAGVVSVDHLLRNPVGFYNEGLKELDERGPASSHFHIPEIRSHVHVGLLDTYLKEHALGGK